MHEKSEMINVYEEAGNSLKNAVSLYPQRFPDRIRSRTVEQFTTDENVQHKKNCRGRVTAANTVAAKYTRSSPLFRIFPVFRKF